MELSFTSYRLNCTHPFGISRSTNDYYDIVYVYLSGAGIIGRGEAAPSARYGETKGQIIQQLNSLDLVAQSAPIGIFLGRIANFINSELYGRETDIIWSVKFIQIDNLSRHPSQIYEAFFEGIVLFILLNFFHRKLTKKIGLISSLFIIYYSLFRFFIEFTREPDAHIKHQ